MGIGPIEIQGSIGRTQDFAQLRHLEENKAQTEQAQITHNTQREVENKANTVKRGDDASKDQRKFDAREKGSNEYHGDGGQNKNKKSDTADGKVFIKGQMSTFDVKI